MAAWIALIAVGLIIAIGVVWRVAAWPCPSWLVPLLENPYFQAVAGAEMLLRRAGIREGMTVLDAGCGPGRVTLPAAARVGRGGRVVALDLQERMLARLRQRLRTQGVANVETLHAALGAGKLAPERFDVALLVTVLGEIPEPEAALREIFAALRPGGVLSITEVLPDPHYQTLRRVRHLADAVGFEEVAQYGGWFAYTINLGRPPRFAA